MELLLDADRAGKQISDFIDGLDQHTFVDDALTQAAVERKFEFIGEALNSLHKSHPELAGRIPKLRRIIDFRNFLIHGYTVVSPGRVWDYAQDSLPQLLSIVHKLIAEMDTPGGE